MLHHCPRGEVSKRCVLFDAGRILATGCLCTAHRHTVAHGPELNFVLVRALVFSTLVYMYVYTDSSINVSFSLAVLLYLSRPPTAVTRFCCWWCDRSSTRSFLNELHTYSSIIHVVMYRVSVVYFSHVYIHVLTSHIYVYVLRIKYRYFASHAILLVFFVLSFYCPRFAFCVFGV